MSRIEANRLPRVQKFSLRHEIWKNRASYLLMAPYFILFFLFTVIPVLMSIYLSFTYFNMLEAPRFVGWSNYIKLLLEDDIFIISLRNTLIFAVVTGPVSYMLCLLFAWIINEFRPKLRAVLTLVFYAPSICGNAYMVWNLILTGDRYGYLNGLLLRLPSREHPSELGEMTHQDKMFGIFKEHHRWQDIIGLRTLGDLNEAISKGMSPLLIQVSEALQEKKIAKIADEIAARKGVRMVLIAGPSSSGKTTTCKRLSVQLLTNGIKPVGISLDDYFVNRENTPRDEKGDYDYEHLHSLNLPLLNEQLTALFRGDEVELPRYDFQTGQSMMSGRKLRLHDDEILVVEGIHALNPELTSQIPQDQIFRVYASALTTILLDSHNYIPTTDNRLLRRIIRDHKYRGVSALETIRRWPSVRAGENKWIFPFQENADVMFNTAMLFELAVIKSQAEPLLEQVPENCVEYAEAYRLLKFLRYIKPIPDSEIPPTSLLREFLGGSSFTY